MNLKGSFSRAAKKLGVALCCLSMIFMAACGPSPQRLGDMAKDPNLHGSTSITMVYQGAGSERVLTIDAQNLKPESRYVYNGTLVVKGDVPAKTEIDVTNGKLEVTGNVGSESTIDVRLPVLTHDETSLVMMPMISTDGNGNMTTTYMLVPQTTTIEDGLAHPGDYGPAVKVDGAIGNKVTITTNGGIHANSWGTEFKARTGYGRTLQQTPAPKPAAPSAMVPSS